MVSASGLLATALAVALGLASALAPYSIVFDGHVPAALCLFAAFMLLTAISGVEALAGPRLRTPADPAEASTPIKRRRCGALFWAGFLVSLSANVDLTLAIFIAVFGLWALFTRWRGLLRSCGWFRGFQSALPPECVSSQRRPRAVRR